MQEVEVDLGQGLAGALLLVRLSEWLGRAIVASRSSLRSLRLSGPLHLGAVFNAMAPYARQFTQLEVGAGGVLLDGRRGGAMAGWQWPELLTSA